MTSDAIQLPDAPGIHGLRFRHFRAGDDFNHMATITRVSAEADDTERADTPEELANVFAHLSNCDPYTDMIFAEVDPGDGRAPEVIGYSRGTWQLKRVLGCADRNHNSSRVNQQRYCGSRGNINAAKAHGMLLYPILYDDVAPVRCQTSRFQP